MSLRRWRGASAPSASATACSRTSASKPPTRARRNFSFSTRPGCGSAPLPPSCLTASFSIPTDSEPRDSPGHHRRGALDQWHVPARDPPGQDAACGHRRARHRVRRHRRVAAHGRDAARRRNHRLPDRRPAQLPDAGPSRTDGDRHDDHDHGTAARERIADLLRRSMLGSGRPRLVRVHDHGASRTRAHLGRLPRRHPRRLCQQPRSSNCQRLPGGRSLIAAGNVPRFLDANGAGFIGGFQASYSRQYGQAVFGIDADISGQPRADATMSRSTRLA